MQQKSVLFISPTPTHPSSAGNRQHIKSLVDFFKAQNWNVHFLYLAFEEFSEEDMNSYFGTDLTILTKSQIFESRKTPDYILKKVSMLFSKLKRRLQYFGGFITKNQLLYNSEVDLYISVFVKPVLKRMQKKHSYNCVVCEYAFISKALTYFDNSVFKIIDTHDRFTDRFQTYLDANSNPSWISLYKDQERKALNRADLILAVSEEDALYFKKLAKRKTSIFNYIPDIVKLPKRKLENKLLYIASSNPNNIASINLFIEDTFPLIIKQHPNTLLIIGGSICEKIKVKHPNISLKGFVDNLEDFYASGDIVINPEIKGTGYKVKAMEALCFGMPLVATSAGAAGVTHDFSDHLFIADNSQKFADVIDLLILNPQLANQTSINAHKWLVNYKERVFKNLISSLPK